MWTVVVAIPLVVRVAVEPESKFARPETAGHLFPGTATEA